MKHYKTSILLLIISTIASAQNVTVNGIRNFTIDNATIFKVDGVAVDNIPKEIIGSGGYKIRFSLNSNDANPTISQGTFAEINLISDIKGRVTSINPLSIMDQAVFTTADTVLDNLNSVDDLVVGDVVSVSGAIDEIDNSMQLTRLERHSDLAQWKLRGFARNITPTTFTIGNLNINLNGITPTDCTSGFVNNSFVEIKATPDSNYSTGQTLATLTSIECQTADVDQGSVGTIPTVVEGIISDIIDLSSFKINNLTVFFNANTSFDNGEIEHLDEGTKVEVQGFIDTDTQFINATTIRFINHRIKMIAPVMPTDVVLNNSITVFGQSVEFIPQTRDDDNIITNGLSSTRQVEIRGFIDSAGQMYAQRIKDKGTADATDTVLRGDITAINKPLLAINSINIDATNSELEIGTGILDIDSFFAQLQLGMQLKIEDATYDSSNHILSFGTIELVEDELEDDPDSSDRSAFPINREIIGSGGVGLATLSGTEIIFASGFE